VLLLWNVRDECAGGVVLMSEWRCDIELQWIPPGSGSRGERCGDLWRIELEGLGLRSGSRDGEITTQAFEISDASHNA